ncbi:MAG: GntR family transcriptional regulator [Oscillospiraceae bacterium]|nr:GntR family transcriptional regulator [Oscillospiraceae bacterium]
MFQIDNQSRVAVYEQILHQAERYILAGLLPPEEKLPSVRSLSVQLGVNPNTVQRAYTELERAGLIVTAPGRGAFVTTGSRNLLASRRREECLAQLRTLVAELVVCGLTLDEIIEEVRRQ